MIYNFSVLNKFVSSWGCSNLLNLS
jgi:hypothetical protein